ncbi:MAG: DUF1127 domain-containing protein [Aestuariivita sp.]|nr:DUF1127 domain-containing protein [Aestuariivita sp.]
MATLDTNEYSAFGAPRLLGQVGFAILSVFSTLIAWNNVRVTRKALSQLSDRELDDIGLVRGDIEMIAQNVQSR